MIFLGKKLELRNAGVLLPSGGSFMVVKTQIFSVKI
jgi:hypothetical protein